jgi:hypothetical protein
MKEIVYTMKVQDLDDLNHNEVAATNIRNNLDN